MAARATWKGYLKISLVNIPIKVFIMNNGYLGMVRQWQELLHDGRYSQSYSAALPDFVKLADAYGLPGMRVDTLEQVGPAMDAAERDARLGTWHRAVERSRAWES